MDFSGSTLLLAFLLTLLAGLSTTIGAAIGIFQREPTPRFLSISLGLSAGVMLYVSFVEILPKSIEVLEESFSGRSAAWIATLAFFLGIALSGLLDKLLMPLSTLHSASEMESVREASLNAQERADASAKRRLYRTGLFTAAAIAIHNFPEGLVTFIATLQDPKLGVAIAVAVALHNIPEGIAVAVPIYHSTGSRLKAFGFACISGLAEPLGALLGYIFLFQFLGEMQFMLGFVFSLVGGIMVYICLDELLPAAREYGEHHLALTGVFVGMGVMALSLLLLL